PRLHLLERQGPARARLHLGPRRRRHPRRRRVVSRARDAPGGVSYSRGAMRKLLLLPLAAASLFGLVACGKGFGSNFEGSITLRTTRGASPPVDMVVKAKGDKLR